MNELAWLRLRKLGVGILRPDCWRALACGVAPAIEHRGVLGQLEIDGVIDVGANRGQFALACRIALPGVPVVAFEPIPSEAAVFRRVHGGRPEVQLVESALGDNRGVATLHLSKRADSSSLLPIGRRQTELFRNTAEVGTMTVPLARLDDFAERWPGRTRQLLKLDVQGYELQVLRGAEQTLRTCRCVYAECSEVALYEGQALRSEVEAFLRARGFAVLRRCNDQVVGGQLIQADYLFGRSPDGNGQVGLA